MAKKQPLYLRVLHRAGLFTKQDVARAVTFTDAKRSPTLEYTQAGLSGVIDTPSYNATIIKLCLQHEVLRTPQEAIIREALRNSYDVAPKYMCKCKDCGAEYQNLKTKCSTPECESTSFIYPDYSQKQKIELLLKQPNRDNTLNQINETLLRCMLGPGDHWLSYQQGEISPSKIAPATVYIEDVVHMAVVWSEENGTVGNGEYFCPACTRDYPKEVYKKGEKCHHCGQSADSETAYVYKTGSEIKARFSRDEVYHGLTHPWLPYFYDNSLVVTALTILMSVTAMDNFNYDNYSTGKLAQILVFMGLSQNEADDLAAAVKRKTQGENQLSLMKQLGVNSEQIQAKAAELRTLYLAGKEGVEAINTMQDSEKMQSLEWWKLWREIVNALYGVQDVAAGAMQAGTTGQNPRMKLDINNNTTEFYQRKLEACWNWVFERLSVTDWIYKCRPVEEKDEAQDQAILKAKLDNIALALSIPGMEAELTDEQEVKISGRPLSFEEREARKQAEFERTQQNKIASDDANSSFEGEKPFKKENVFANEKGQVKSKYIVTELKTE